MRKFTIGLAFLSFLMGKSFAQTVVPCETDEMELKLESQYPQISANKIAFQQFVAQWIANNKNSGLRDDDTTEYIIPVVYHIIHDYGAENISDDQVRDDIAHVNIDWNKMNADTSQVIPEFKDIIGNGRVTFRLATKTPGGDCTNGIEHIHSLTTYNGGEQSKIGAWPRSMYLNIWTVKSLPSPPGTIVGAYAFQPATAALPFLAPYDGIISRSDAIGTIGTADPIWRRTISHECGHIFGLNHPWTSTNGPIGVACGDDGISDTPITKGWFSVCPTESTAKICTPGVVENYQNIMDYASCKVMFTDGQITEVHGALNSPTAERSLLWSASNLVATGVDDTSVHPVCTPRVDFYSSPFMACTGTTITFHDVSWGATVDSRTWDFGDGNPSSSTDQNPLVTFSTPGWKTITLTATNSAGNATVTREKFVYISNDQGQHPIGWFENFEDPNSFDNDYVVQNREGNASAWQRYSGAGYLSSNCVYLNNYKNMVGDIDNLITPSYDLSAGGPVYLNFRFSCASNAISSDNIADILKIYTSTDCGRTWILRNTTQGVDLANAGYYSGNYVPTLSSQWEAKSILLPSSVIDPDVRFRFEYTTTGTGNNIYIDDINVSAYPVGISDPSASSFNVKVFPNPVDESSVISVQQQYAGKMNLALIDQTGRVLRIVYDGWLSEGTHQFDLKASDIKVAGMYYLVADDGLNISRVKIVVQ